MPDRKDSNSDISLENQKEILDILKALTVKVDTLSKSVTNLDNTSEDIIKSIEHCCQTCQEALTQCNQNKHEIQALNVELTQHKYDNAQLKSKLTKLEDKIVRIESQSRKDNLLIDGIEESDKENCALKLQHVFTNIMKLEDVQKINIVRCHRLGEKRVLDQEQLL